MPGDRFIVRDAGTAETISGGIVLDADPPPRRRRSASRLRRLDALEQTLADGDLTSLLRETPSGIAMTSTRLRCRDRSLAERLAPLIAAGRFDPPWVRDLASAVRRRLS